MSLARGRPLFYHAADPSPIVEVDSPSTSDNCAAFTASASVLVSVNYRTTKEIGLPKYPSGVRDRMKPKGDLQSLWP